MGTHNITIMIRRISTYNLLRGLRGLKGQRSTVTIGVRSADEPPSIPQRCLKGDGPVTRRSQHGMAGFRV